MTKSVLQRELEAPDPRLERVALAVAHELEPSVDIEATVGVLDELAEPLVVPAHRVETPEDGARLLAHHLGTVLGITGNTDDYYDPENSFLDRVIARKRGIPIALSVLYAAIGSRVGLTVEGVGFPGHFLVRVGGPEGRYQDPFHGGRLLSEEDLDLLASRFLGPGVPIARPHLAVVEPRTVALRMLANLQVAYARRGLPARAIVAADRLYCLTGDVGYRRDRGLHALAMGTPDLAVEDLEAYVAERPRAQDRARVQEVIEQARRRGNTVLH